MKFKDMNAEQVLRAISDIIKELILGADEDIENAIRGRVEQNGKLTNDELKEIESAAYQAYKSTFKRLADSFIDDDFIEYGPDDIISRESNDNEIIYQDDDVIHEDDTYAYIEPDDFTGNEFRETISEFVKNHKEKRRKKKEKVEELKNDNNKEEC